MATLGGVDDGLRFLTVQVALERLVYDPADLRSVELPAVPGLRLFYDPNDFEDPEALTNRVAAEVAASLGYRGELQFRALVGFARCDAAGAPVALSDEDQARVQQAVGEARRALGWPSGASA